MHVLAAAHDFYPDPGFGGTGRYAYETLSRLVDRGHRATVVTRQRGDAPIHSVVDGIEVYRYSFRVDGRNAPSILGQLPRAASKVSTHISGVDPDIVSYQGPMSSVLVDRVVEDAPRLTTYHSPWPTEYAIKARHSETWWPRRRLNTAVRRAVERHVLRRSDVVVTLSNYMSRVLAEVHGMTADHVVPGGVDVERFHPDNESLCRGDDVTYLTVPRLSPRMGHRLLLDAYREVEEGLDAELLVAGTGPLRQELEREAVRKDVAGSTEFLGYVPDSSLPNLYSAADVFVLPTTRLEGFGLATLEALASGTPVVATDVGGTTELLDGLQDRLPNGSTVQPRAEELAGRMLEWGSLSQEGYMEACRTCRRYAEQNYCWGRVVDRLEDLYLRYAR